MQQFETARLIMRPLRPEDQAFYCSCYTDAVLMQHIGEPLTLEAALRSFAAALKTSSTLPVRRRTWVLQEKASGMAIGLLAMFCDQARPEPVNAELGSITLGQFQNQGFAVESLRELANIAFSTTQLEALLVKHKSNNKAVTGVMAKLGFLLDMDSSGANSSTQWILRRAYWQSSRTEVLPA